MRRKQQQIRARRGRQAGNQANSRKGCPGLRKFKNLVIGGIENKIFNLILVAVILITVTGFLVTDYQNRVLSGLTAETSVRQREAIGEITDSVMDQVIDQNMDRIIGMEAYIADEMFRELKNRVQIMAEYAVGLLRNTGDIEPRAYGRPDASLEGRLAPKMLLAEGIDPDDPEVQRKLGLLANMSEAMKVMCFADEAKNAYLTTTDGLTLMVDTVGAGWVAQDGSPLAYDGRTRYWYRQAVEAGETIFTDVEIDRPTGNLCVSCAMPVYREDNGELVAVVSSDLFLNEMQEKVFSSVSEGGTVIIVNQDGHVILSPSEDGTFRVYASDEAEDLRQNENAELAAFVADAMQAKTGIRPLTVDGKDYYVSGVPMETVGWTLIAAFDREVARQPARMLQESYKQIEGEATAAYREKKAGTRRFASILLAALMVLMLVVALFLGKRIVRPLNRIIKRISDISETDMEFKMEDAYRTGDEIQVLAESFAAVSHKTVEYVHEVTRITAEKERIGTELHMANQIQNSMLPQVFPPFPDRPELDIYASMTPAKEVGGDFYDFFMIDDDHLCLVMADVSGKSVPAALFMMISKVILQSCAMLGQSVSEILNKTNEALCSNNQVEMFVTVWLGILEISTGKMTAANAGHEYPAIRRADGGFELFRDKHGFVVGGMPQMKYKGYELQLNPGDKLFVYTDGVPEATNAENELFGTDRMIDALNRDPDASCRQVLLNVRSAVDDFVQDAEQFDDLTMMCLEYKGTKNNPQPA